MKNIDIRDIKCFGAESPKDSNWVDLVADLQWRDQTLIEKSLARQVDESYLNLCSFKFKDLDDDFDYECKFDNQQRGWDVRIVSNPDVEIMLDDKLVLFKNEDFKKLCLRASRYIRESEKLLDKIIVQHLRDGDLISVDEVKFDAITSFIKDPILMKNLKNGVIIK